MMQKRCLFLILLGISELIFGQHFIEKSFEASSKNIEISCTSIDNLKLISTSGNNVKISLKDAQDRFSNIDVYSEKDRLFIKQKESLPQESINKFCVEQPVFVSYIISVPNNSQVFVNMVSGNLNIENFKGFVNAQLETGAVTLDNNSGDINLKIVDGSVKVKIKNTQLHLASNLGEITSEIPTLLPSESKKLLTGIYQNGQHKLTIKAIKANIFLEAVKD